MASVSKKISQMSGFFPMDLPDYYKLTDEEKVEWYKMRVYITIINPIKDIFENHGVMIYNPNMPTEKLNQSSIISIIASTLFKESMFLTFLNFGELYSNKFLYAYFDGIAEEDKSYLLKGMKDLEFGLMSTHLSFFNKSDIFWLEEHKPLGVTVLNVDLQKFFYEFCKAFDKSIEVLMLNKSIRKDFVERLDKIIKRN